MIRLIEKNACSYAKLRHAKSPGARSHNLNLQNSI